METFFAEADYREYLYLMAEWCNRCKVQVWAYCLILNHIHLIATARYIELNPVRAGIVKNAKDYKWSSCRAHIQGEDDILVKVRLLLKIMLDWQKLLSTGLSEDDYETIRRHERTGRPLGGESLIDHLEQLTSRLLRKKKPGPKKDN